MEATFLGHQTWHIKHDDSTVLVDPVLSEHFGHSSAISAKVFPPRKIDVGLMPPADAIVLSHEHSDHFTFASFSRLPKDTLVIVGPLMPEVLVEAIESVGMKVQRRPPGEWISIGSLEVRLFPAVMPESFWEQRVSQVYVRPREIPHRGIFIGVDAALSPFFVQSVESGEVPPPRLVVVANNSQYVPPGGQSIYSNPLSDVGFDDTGPFVGLDLLDGLTLGYVAELPDGCDVAIAGNGFVHVRQPFGPYLLSDNRRLAEIANRLSVKPWVHGPRPGDSLILHDKTIESHKVSWVQIDNELEEEFMAKHRAFLAQPRETKMTPILTADTSGADARAKVLAELPRLGEAFAYSRLAAQAHRVHEYLSGPLGARRFVMRFLDEKGTLQVAYDHTLAKFVEDDTGADALLETFPFGVEMFLCDFAGILDGRIQIWDLDGAAIRSWFFGPSTDSPVTFLYAALGEQVRPELAAKIYLRALRRLDVQPLPGLLRSAE